MPRQYSSSSETSKMLHREKLAEQRHKQNSVKRIKTIVCGMFSVFTVIFILFTVLHCMKVASDTDKLNGQIAEKQTMLTEKEEALKNVEVVTEYVDPVLNNANNCKVAVNLCNWQNKMNALVANDADYANNNEYKKLLHDNNQYIEPVPGNIGRGVWCKYGTWIYDANYAYEGNMQDVVWRCYAPDDVDIQSKLIAYATAKYDNNTQLIHDFELHYTSYYTILNGEATGTPITDTNNEAAPNSSLFETNEPKDSADVEEANQNTSENASFESKTEETTESVTDKVVTEEAVTETATEEGGQE